MREQSYTNHARYVGPFHLLIPSLLLLALTGFGYGTYRSFAMGHSRIVAVSQLLLVIAVAVLTWYAREFPLKAQDRAIRAEEALRHYLLTGGPLDPRLSIRQIIALRFASDGELPGLARRAAEEGLRPSEIKRAVTSWRADLYRV